MFYIRSVAIALPNSIIGHMNYTAYTIDDLQDMYSEAKYMAFMCLYASDRGNWRKWCRTASDINLSIHIKSQEITQ